MATEAVSQTLFPGNRHDWLYVAKREKGTIHGRYGCDHCNGRIEERAGEATGARSLRWI